MTNAIAGVNGVYVVVDTAGKIFSVDGASGGKIAMGTLSPSPVPPLSIAAGLGGGAESCAIVDAAGTCWRGTVRPPGSFKKV